MRTSALIFRIPDNEVSYTADPDVLRSGSASPVLEDPDDPTLEGDSTVPLDDESAIVTNDDLESITARSAASSIGTKRSRFSFAPSVPTDVSLESKRAKLSSERARRSREHRCFAMMISANKVT